MPDRPPPRLRLADRQQVIPAMPLENLLDAAHQARLVWDFCQGLDLACLYDQILSRLGGPGHPAIDPRLCTALWLYATREGVGSARALVDGGFAKHQDIEAAAGQGEGCTVYAPVPAPKDPQHDR